MLVEILIPTFNNAKFLIDCLDGALKTADLLDSRVILSVNHCTDSTEEILKRYFHEKLTIVRPERFLSGGDNFRFCMQHSSAKYLILCGSDDILDPEGQILLANIAKLNPKAQVIFGYDEIIDVDLTTRRTHEYSPHWRKLNAQKIISNAFSGRNPNQNGSWIRRELCESFNLEYANQLKSNDFTRVGDLYFWLFVCSRLIRNNTIENNFLYLHVKSIYYREYFEKTKVYRDPEILMDTNVGRIKWIDYAYNNISKIPSEFKKSALLGLTTYVSNTFPQIYSSIGKSDRENWVRSLAEKDLIKRYNYIYLMVCILSFLDFMMPFIFKLRLKTRSLARKLLSTPMFNWRF